MRARAFSYSCETALCRSLPPRGLNACTLSAVREPEGGVIRRVVLGLAAGRGGVLPFGDPLQLFGWRAADAG